MQDCWQHYVNEPPMSASLSNFGFLNFHIKIVGTLKWLNFIYWYTSQQEV
jgi:hypothetical protein